MKQLAAYLFLIIAFTLTFIVVILTMPGYGQVHIESDNSGTHWWKKDRLKDGPTRCEELDTSQGGNHPGTQVSCLGCTRTRPPTCGATEFGQPTQIWCFHDEQAWDCRSGTSAFCPSGDPCTPDPCFNGGVCTIGAGCNFICLCPCAFCGPQCEVLCPTTTTTTSTTSTTTTTTTVTTTTGTGPTTTSTSTTTTTTSTTTTTAVLTNVGKAFVAEWDVGNSDTYGIEGTNASTPVGNSIVMPVTGMIVDLCCSIENRTAPGGTGWVVDEAVSNAPGDEAHYSDAGYSVSVTSFFGVTCLSSTGVVIQGGRFIVFHATPTGTPGTDRMHCGFRLIP